MREIIFRGKRVDDGEWVEGSSRVANWGSDENKKSHTYEHVFILRQGVTLGAYRDENNIQHLDCQVFEVIPETVGQYTGLEDKNGLKKIFEGDIVTHFSNYLAKRINKAVTFEDGSFMSGEAFLIDWVECGGVEIIGNIHDNPELLM